MNTEEIERSRKQARWVGYCDPGEESCVLHHGHEGEHVAKSYSYSDHLLEKGHPVRKSENYEEIRSIGQTRTYETWNCMHPDCDYIELRLKEGHTV